MPLRRPVHICPWCVVTMMAACLVLLSSSPVFAALLLSSTCHPPRWRVGQACMTEDTPASSSADALTPASTSAEALERLFFDTAEVYVRSGAGGEGAVSFVGQRPAGGSGGAGGSVYVECSSNYNTLAHLQRGASTRAERGHDAKEREAGRRGTDSVVLVPPNCRVVTRDKAGETEALGVLVQPGDRLLVASGGHGGEGNGELWRRARSGSGKTCGAAGGTERRWLELSMTLVADVGLVGIPSAGKSTLLRAVTRARPKVGDYPFTTLIPNMGVCELDRIGQAGRSMVWLDIPGLIEGAAEGKGLGHAFLRHVERCRLLIHLIDGEADNPATELSSINAELERYSPALARTPQAIVLTKADLPNVAARLPEALAALKAAARHERVLAISSHDGSNLDPLLRRTRTLLDQLDKARASD